MNPAMMPAAPSWCCPAARGTDRLHALDHHHRANDAQKEHIDDRNGEIDLTDIREHLEEIDAAERP